MWTFLFREPNPGPSGTNCLSVQRRDPHCVDANFQSSHGEPSFDPSKQKKKKKKKKGAMSSGTPSVIKGSCFCKGIQYEVPSGTAQWIRCHCTMCRKLIGADHCTYFAVPNSKLQLKARDTLKTYRSSKEAVRSFCTTCGCSVFMKYDIETNTIWIGAGTLDHEIPITKPTRIFLDDKAYWLETMSTVAGSGDIANWEVDCAKDL